MWQGKCKLPQARRRWWNHRISHLEKVPESSHAVGVSEAMEPMEFDMTRIESIFVRRRNALWIRGSFTGLFTDYYIHLMEQKIRHNPELDMMLKEHIVLLGLYLTTRPWAETTGWTVNLRAPRVNLFAAGGCTQEAIVGRLFTEDVREPDRNYFYAQTTAAYQKEPRLSTMEMDSRDPLRWFEQFYHQSEQRPGKAFHMGDDDYAVVVAQPDCDLEWLESLDVEAVKHLERTEEVKLLEVRHLRFFCGCDLMKILPLLASWRDRMDDLFGELETIQVQCPRCAAVYPVSRDMVLAFQSNQ
jgi:molecular chaperone Hsp33